MAGDGREAPPESGVGGSIDRRMQSVSRALRLIQSIGEALARPREAEQHANLEPVARGEGGDAERPSLVVAAVRRLARGTRPPTQS